MVLHQQQLHVPLVPQSLLKHGRPKSLARKLCVGVNEIYVNFGVSKSQTIHFTYAWEHTSSQLSKKCCFSLVKMGWQHSLLCLPCSLSVCLVYFTLFLSLSRRPCPSYFVQSYSRSGFLVSRQYLLISESQIAWFTSPHPPHYRQMTSCYKKFICQNLERTEHSFFTLLSLVLRKNKSNLL